MKLKSSDPLGTKNTLAAAVVSANTTTGGTGIGSPGSLSVASTSVCTRVEDLTGGFVTPTPYPPPPNYFCSPCTIPTPGLPDNYLLFSEWISGALSENLQCYRSSGPDYVKFPLVASTIPDGSFNSTGFSFGCGARSELRGQGYSLRWFPGGGAIPGCNPAVACPMDTPGCYVTNPFYTPVLYLTMFCSNSTGKLTLAAAGYNTVNLELFAFGPVLPLRPTVFWADVTQPVGGYDFVTGVTFVDSQPAGAPVNLQDSGYGGMKVTNAGGTIRIHSM